MNKRQEELAGLQKEEMTMLKTIYMPENIRCAPIVEEIYKPSKGVYFLALIPKIISFLLGIWLTFFIYNNCMFSECNPFVTVYFIILALLCFQAAGVSVDKLVKIQFPK